MTDFLGNFSWQLLFSLRVFTRIIFSYLDLLEMPYLEFWTKASRLISYVNFNLITVAKLELFVGSLPWIPKWSGSIRGWTSLSQVNLIGTECLDGLWIVEYYYYVPSSVFSMSFEWAYLKNVFCHGYPIVSLTFQCHILPQTLLQKKKKKIVFRLLHSLYLNSVRKIAQNCKF